MEPGTVHSPPWIWGWKHTWHLWKTVGLELYWDLVRIQLEFISWSLGGECIPKVVCVSRRAVRGLASLLGRSYDSIKQVRMKGGMFIHTWGHSLECNLPPLIVNCSVVHIQSDSLSLSFSLCTGHHCHSCLWLWWQDALVVKAASTCHELKLGGILHGVQCTR